MIEPQKLSMQEVPSIARETGEAFKRLAGFAVQGVAYKRMADRSEMDSDLMRAA